MMEFNSLKILNHFEDNLFPVSVEIDPSNLCNHNCDWCCFKESKKKSPEIIPEDILFDTIEELAKWGTKSITFTGGGEPLMNPCTIGAIEFASELGIKTGLITNGGLLSLNDCSIIVDNCTFVRVSLDAGNYKTHMKLHNTTPQEFGFIIETLEDLIKFKKESNSDITIGVSFLAHTENFHEIPDLARRLDNMGVDYLQIKPIYYLKGGFHLVTRTFPKIKTKHLKIIPMNKRIKEIGLETKKNYKKCRIHNYLTIIGADSKVYLCCPYRGKRKFCLGDLKKSTFKQIWNSERRKKVISKIDVTKCPYCRHNDYNEILEYLDSDKPHGDFL